MSKFQLLTIAVAALLAINIGIIGFLLLRRPSMPRFGREPMRQEGPKKIIIERLHFNKEQVASYEAFIADHQTAVKALKDSISTTKNELYQSLKTDSLEGKDALITRLGDLQRRMETVHYDHFIQLKKLCTPDQLQDFNSLTQDLATYFGQTNKR